MTLFLRLFILFIYLTLLYELIGIPVPSVASTYQLFFSSDSFKKPNSLLTKVRAWPMPLKFLCLFLPTGLVVLIYLLPLAQAIWPPFQQFLHLIRWSNNIVAVALGTVLALLGRYLGLRAAWSIHQKQQMKETHSDLKTKDVFSFSRNPILLGMYVTFIGLWVLVPSWEMGLGFILFVINMHFRVLLEEEFLSWRFGADYEQFLGATRRYL